jgi:hypothetical protein
MCKVYGTLPIASLAPNDESPGVAPLTEDPPGPPSGLTKAVKTPVDLLFAKFANWVTAM